MNYLKRKFTNAVTPGGDESLNKYRDNWDRIFGKNLKCVVCDKPVPSGLKELKVCSPLCSRAKIMKNYEEPITLSSDEIIEKFDNDEDISDHIPDIRRSVEL